MAVPALERCVGDIDSFFANHWAVAPLLREAPAPGAGFDDLASLGDLDHMVSSLGLHQSSLRMVRDARTLPDADYTLGSVRAGRGSEPRISAPLVYQRYQEGATIVLESLHRYWRPLTEFCRELETSLGHRLQVNAYITPPGSQGFDVHRDDHDVFVLQVSGSKQWIVYDRNDPGRVLIDRAIDKGAALYIPAGFPHGARTGSAASAHLTVGIRTHDAIDVVREVTKLAEEQPVFRERLDLRGVNSVRSLKGTVQQQVDETRSWLDKLDLDELTERVARRLLTTTQPVTHGLLTELERLDQVDRETIVERRAGTICVVIPKDTKLKVLLVDRELEMPLLAREAMEEISRRNRLSTRDLEPLLGAEGALVLVRRLIREGLLEVAVGR